MALTPGLLLSDRYRLTSRIAVGGMGEVWAADDTRLARTIAVKILKSELTSDPEFVDRFRSEARITASLNHPGIAQVHDYGEVASIAGGPRDTAFLVMELVTGEPLSAVLARTPRLSVPRTLDVLEQSGKALQVAHARALVHRDIKPGNILITPTGQVKITDFGIAKVAHQVPVTRGGMVMGTAQYLSPEQASGNEAVPASDVYALGVVAYECLAGRRPFGGDHPLAVAMAQVRDDPPPLPPDVPPPVAALVMRMLAKDPARRFPNGAALARAVAAVRAGSLPSGRAMVTPGPITGAVPVPAPAPVPQPLPTPPPMRADRRTGLAVLIAVAVLVIAALTVVLVYRQAGGGQPPPATIPAGTGQSEPLPTGQRTPSSTAPAAGGAGEASDEAQAPADPDEEQSEQTTGRPAPDQLQPGTPGTSRGPRISVPNRLPAIPRTSPSTIDPFGPMPPSGLRSDTPVRPAGYELTVDGESR